MVLLILGILVSLLGKVGVGVLLIVSFLMEWFYPVLFEVLRDGQTPGKKLMGITVVNDDLTPVGWGASITRNLLRAADFLPLFYMVGVISTLLQKDAKRLGDIAAGTIVIYRENMAHDKVDIDAKPSPPPFVVQPHEQLAFVEFAQRQESFSESRQLELADTLKPLTSKQGLSNVRMIRSACQWFMGGVWSPGAPQQSQKASGITRDSGSNQDNGPS